jgi:ABC-type transport system substrate-binding protein
VGSVLFFSAPRSSVRPKRESADYAAADDGFKSGSDGSTKIMKGVSKTRRTLMRAVAALPATAGLRADAASVADPGSGSKVLRYPFEVAESGFDPAQLSDIYSRIVTAHIFDGLYEYDHLARPFRIRPCTADGMPETSEDFRVWTVRVRPGIYFPDDPAFKGVRRELVAEDYVYSLKRFFDPRWKSPAYGGMNELRLLGMAPLRNDALKTRKPFDYDTPAEGLRTLDRYTLQFRFEQPQPRFLESLSGGDLWGAVAREVVEAYGDDIPAHPVGTGPFRLGEWRRSSRIVLERNPSYREVVYDAEPNADDAEGQELLRRFKGRRLPMIDRVEISIIEEIQPRWLSFLNKQQDVMWLLPYDFVNIAAPGGKLSPALAREGVRMYRALASDVTLTYFNMEDPVVGGYTPEKVALRRAISLAIDVDQEIRLYWRGQAVPAQSALVPNTTGYDPSFRSANSQYDLAQAKALLDIFGYVDRDGDGWREQPDGSPLVLDWATTPDQRARQRDELRRKDMNALGIRVNFKPAKWPENLKNARAGKLMVWNLGSSAAGPDGGSALDRAATIHKGGQNLARFSNRQFDELYTRIKSMPDGPERERLFFEGKRILTAYAPYKNHVHRILTDLTWPWVIGFRRPPYWLSWWQYVDVDTVAQRKATS